jgi:hypothetical protein
MFVEEAGAMDFEKAIELPKHCKNTTTIYG